MTDQIAPEGAWLPRSDDEYYAEVVAGVGEQLASDLARVRLLVLDADGVLTPGNLLYGPQGEALKEFHSHDGLGLVMARKAGLKLAVLTGRDSAIVQQRATELRFAAIKLARFDKATALREICDEVGCDLATTAYVGDDLIDLPAMAVVAVPIAVPEAPPEVQHCGRWVTRAAGGRGAVREVTDLLLKCQRRYRQALIRLAGTTGPEATQ